MQTLPQFALEALRDGVVCAFVMGVVYLACVAMGA